MIRAIFAILGRSSFGEREAASEAIRLGSDALANSDKFQFLTNLVFIESPLDSARPRRWTFGSLFASFFASLFASLFADLFRSLLVSFRKMARCPLRFSRIKTVALN